jgi:sugar (pentulose or hexulose) kinase
MNKSAYLLGIDIGSSSVKTAIINASAGFTPMKTRK